MDDETRAAFARIDRWFELSQSQHQELRHDMQELRQQISRLDAGLTALFGELRTFRLGDGSIRGAARCDPAAHAAG